MKPNKIYHEVIQHFSQPDIAMTFPASFNEAEHKDACDKAAIEKSLTYFEKGQQVLDLPCGSGRLTPLILARGLRTTGADSSHAMLKEARLNHEERQAAQPQLPQVDYKLAEIMNTPFETNQFHGVICNGLFQHYDSSEIRQLAIHELARVSSNFVVISFMCADGAGKKVSPLKRLFQKKTADIDPRLVSRKDLQAELNAQGLTVVEWIPSDKNTSRHWYVVAQKG